MPRGVKTEGAARFGKRLVRREWGGLTLPIPVGSARALKSPHAGCIEHWELVGILRPT